MTLVESSSRAGKKRKTLTWHILNSSCPVLSILNHFDLQDDLAFRSTKFWKDYLAARFGRETWSGSKSKRIRFGFLTGALSILSSYENELKKIFFAGFWKSNIQWAWNEWVCSTEDIGLYKSTWCSYRRNDSERNIVFFSKMSRGWRPLRSVNSPISVLACKYLWRAWIRWLKIWKKKICRNAERVE